MQILSDIQQAYLLDEAKSGRLYEFIKAKSLNQLSPDESGKLIAIYTAGQPGSGKTQLRNHILNESGLSRSTVVINTDELREFHPSYGQLMANKDTYTTAPHLVNLDSVKWAEQLRADAIKGKYNLLFDVTLGGKSEHFIRSMQELKEAGYTIKIAVLAVKPELSRLGIHLRYEMQLKEKGAGRFVKMATHDYNYRNIPVNLNEILTAIPIDDITIYKRKIYRDETKEIRNNAVERVFHYDNTKNSEHGINKDVIIGQIETERNRPWTKIEKEYLTARVCQVETLITDRGGDLKEFRGNIEPVLKEIGVKTEKDNSIEKM